MSLANLEWYGWIVFFFLADSAIVDVSRAIRGKAVDATRTAACLTLVLWMVQP